MTAAITTPGPTSEFLPAERTLPAVLATQRATIAAHPALPAICNAIPHPLAVLNGERQIIFANTTLATMAHSAELDLFTAPRPGEALGCEVASRASGGCGTDVDCQNCGAALAIAAAQEGSARELACTIDRTDEVVPLEFAASASPLSLDGEDFILLVLTDIQDQRRRRILERIFFHDVINTAGGLQGLGEMLAASLPTGDVDLEELGQMLVASSQQLLEEIQAQRDLAAAESGDLTVDRQPTDLGEATTMVADRYRHHHVAKDRKIAIERGPEAIIDTDPVLFGRVLGNLLKNALEAITEGQQVTVSWQVADSMAILTVHNPGEIAASVRGEFFRRSVTTKGGGRGQGTYSVRLLTEHYLRGRITWTSEAIAGTSISIHLPLDGD